MREYKYKARFEAKARCVLQPENGKFLSNASLADLKTILPSDAALYPDLLPIAGNTCVINLGNGNGDMMDTEVGVKLFPQFIHKPINLEHDRSSIVGHITTAALSKFSSNYALGSGSDILTAADVENTLDPFNIAIGGFVYRALFKDVCDKILESNDPDSPEFLSVAFSWELAFDEHKLFVGSKERGGPGEIISDPDKIQAWSSYLKSRRGSGLTPDGRPLYRLVSWARKEDGQIDPDSVLALGVALTLAPAGAVAGIVTHKLPTSSASSATLVENQEKEQNSSELISQTSTANVTSNTTIKMKILKSLDDLKQLNDENVKETSFANIQHIVEAGVNSQISDAIKAKNQEWEAAASAKAQEAAAAQKEAQEAITKVKELEASLKATTDALNKIEVAHQQAEATQKYNERMAFFDEKFELTDGDRKAIASRIKGLDDASFTAIANDELSVFLAPKSKEVLAAAAAASKVTPEVKVVAQEALASVTPTDAALPNGVQPGETLKAKYAAAFEKGKGIKFDLK